MSKFSARVHSSVPVAASSLFHPARIRRTSCLLWHALYQHDAQRVGRAHSWNSHTGHLELRVDVVDQHAMSMLTPLLEKNRRLRTDAADDVVVASSSADSNALRHFRRNLHPRATDILAFPDEFVTRSVLPQAGLERLIFMSGLEPGSLANGREFREPGAASCGSIVLCPHQMCANLDPHAGAQRRGSPPRRVCCMTMEMYVLSAMTHSFLHLFGYTHESDAAEAEMVAMERRVGRTVSSWIAHGC